MREPQRLRPVGLAAGSALALALHALPGIPIAVFEWDSTSDELQWVFLVPGALSAISIVGVWTKFRVGITATAAFLQIFVVAGLSLFYFIGLLFLPGLAIQCFVAAVAWARADDYL